MQVRSYGLTSNEQFRLHDWTEEVNIIPNQWGFLQALNLFEVEPVSQHTVSFESTQTSGAILIDRVRGKDRGQQGKDPTRQLHSFSIPHFPHDDYISPQDLQGVRAYGADGNGNIADTLSAVRTRKLERIRQNHAWTWEAARAQLITQGTVYAPAGTVVQDWNAEFGVTRTTVDFLLGNSSTDVVAAVEACIAQVQDNAFGAQADGALVLCSPLFFRKLISHPAVKTAYTYFKQSGANPLMDRLAPGFNMGLRRQFDFGGAVFVELRDQYAGTPLIPSGNAYMVPLGTSGVFKTFVSPAQRFNLTNTLGEEVYVFETMDPKGTQYELETESNFANAVMRPAMIVTLTSST